MNIIGIITVLLVLVKHFEESHCVLSLSLGQGQSPQRGGTGTAPSVGQRAKPPEADCISVLEHTFCAVVELAVAADLTEATRPRRTFDTAAILSVND